VLLTKYYSGEQIEKNEMGGACSTYGGEMHTGLWWGNLRERGYLEDPWGRWEDNIKIALQEVERGGGWYGQVAGTCECGNEPSGSIKYGEFLN